MPESRKAGRPPKFAGGTKTITVQLPIDLAEEMNLCRAVIKKRSSASESPLEQSEYIREALRHLNAAIRAGRFKSFRQSRRVDEYPIVSVGRPQKLAAAAEEIGES